VFFAGAFLFAVPNMCKIGASFKLALCATLALVLIATPLIAGAEIKVDLLRNGVGVPPLDFHFGQTGGGPDAKWAVIRDAEATQGAALEQYSTDRYEGRLPLAIYKDLWARNIIVASRLKLMNGSTKSAGIAARLVNAGNYYVAVANALEGRVDLFRFIEGQRKRIAGLEADVTKQRWHSLQLAVNENRFTVSIDGVPLFDAYDSALMKEGQVALWTEEDNIARFDDLTIIPIGSMTGK